MIITRTLVFRAKLSRATHTALEAFLEEMRVLWNAALEERIDAYRKAGVSISWVDQFKSLTEIRRTLPEYSRCSVTAQRSVLKRLDHAFQGFFRRNAAGRKPGFPRFRSRNRGVRSFEMPVPAIRKKGRWNTIAVKGIGRFRFAGKIEGDPKVLRIVKSPRRVTVQVVVEREAAKAVDTRRPIGIDAGIVHRAALSTGETVPGRKLDRTILVKRQRKLFRAKRGSRSRCKKRLALAKAWQLVKENDRGMLHELTAKLVRDHGARFYVENLKIPNLLRNRHLARSIAEQNWGTFVSLLTYKAEEAGGWVRKVPPHHTSQLCSDCGAMPEKRLTLAERTYKCASCGNVEDRDVNAAKNILQVGLTLHPPGGALPGAPGGGRQRSAGRKVGLCVTARNSVESLAALAVTCSL